MALACGLRRLPDNRQQQRGRQRDRGVAAPRFEPPDPEGQAAQRIQTWGIGRYAPGHRRLTQMKISLLAKIDKNCARRLQTGFPFPVAERLQRRTYAATGSTPAFSQRSKRRRIDTMPDTVQVPLRGFSMPSWLSVVPEADPALHSW